MHWTSSHKTEHARQIQPETEFSNSTFTFVKNVDACCNKHYKPRLIFSKLKGIYVFWSTFQNSLYTMLTSGWRTRRRAWTKISSKCLLLSHCSWPVTNLWPSLSMLLLPQSPGSTITVPLASWFRDALYLPWFVFLFVFDVVDQTQSLVHAQASPAPSPAWFYFIFLLNMFLFWFGFGLISSCYVPGQKLTILLPHAPGSRLTCSSVLSLGCKKHRKGLDGKLSPFPVSSDPSDRVLISCDSGTLQNVVSTSISGTNSNDKSWSDG